MSKVALPFRVVCATSFFLCAPLATFSDARCDPVLVEEGWQLTRSTPVSSEFTSAVYNPIDQSVYLVNETALLKWDAGQPAPLVVTTGNFQNIGVNDANGDLFISNGVSEAIWKVTFGTAIAQSWVSGFRPGDDDPAGLDIAPPGYSGNVALPGEGIVVDRGVLGSPNGIFKFSSVTPEGEILISSADSILSPDDVTFTDERVYIVDPGRTDTGFANGGVYELNGDGTLSVLLAFPDVDHPQSIAWDASTGDLIVGDFGFNHVYRVDPVFRTKNVILDFAAVGAGARLTAHPGSIDVSPDGRVLLVVAREANQWRLYQFEFTEPQVNPTQVPAIGNLGLLFASALFCALRKYGTEMARKPRRCQLDRRRTFYARN